jgi:hypothetical protein
MFAIDYAGDKIGSRLIMDEYALFARGVEGESSSMTTQPQFSSLMLVSILDTSSLRVS